MAGDARTPHPSLFQRQADWSARRWGNHIVAPGAAFFAILGVGLIVAPRRYESAFYQFVFSTVPARPAGVAFLAVGVAALAYPTRLTVAALVAAHVCWGLTCALTAVLVDGVSPTVWAYPVVVAWMLFVSVAARPAPTRRRQSPPTG